MREAKSHLSQLADRVKRDNDRVLVTRNGRPAFVMIGPDDLESLEETVDVLRDDELGAEPIGEATNHYGRLLRLRSSRSDP